jgi:hypothetical protein
LCLEGKKTYVSFLCGLRALTLTASLLASTTAALGQDQKSTEEDHEQHQQQPGNDPQDDSHYDISKMAGMDHSAMEHSGMNSSGMFLMNESSGTEFQPAAWPMPMLMTRASDWRLMWMGQAFIVDTQQSGPRGGDKLYSVNWGMLGAVHKLGRGSLMLRSMSAWSPPQSQTAAIPCCLNRRGGVRHTTRRCTTSARFRDGAERPVCAPSG